MPANTSYGEKMLLLQIAEGDEAAFMKIHRAYYPAIYLFARRILPNYEELAQDATAETFIDLWKSKKKFEDLEHLQKHLRVMVRYKCIDKLREERKNAAMVKELEYLSENDFEGLYYKDVVYTAAVIRKIRDEVEKLPPHTRNVFKLAFFEGLNNAEIATRTGIKNATVRVRKAEALHALRMRFSDEEMVIILLLFIQS